MPPAGSTLHTASVHVTASWWCWYSTCTIFGGHISDTYVTATPACCRSPSNNYDCWTLHSRCRTKLGGTKRKGYKYLHIRGLHEHCPYSGCSCRDVLNVTRTPAAVGVLLYHGVPSTATPPHERYRGQIRQMFVKAKRHISCALTGHISHVSCMTNLIFLCSVWTLFSVSCSFVLCPSRTEYCADIVQASRNWRVTSYPLQSTEVRRTSQVRMKPLPAVSSMMSCSKTDPTLT